MQHSRFSTNRSALRAASTTAGWTSDSGSAMLSRWATLRPSIVSPARATVTDTGLFDLDARSLDLVDGVVAVTRVEFHGSDAFQEDDSVEPLGRTVQRGLLHAVVGGQAQDDQPFDPPGPEDRFQAGSLHGPSAAIANG